MSTIRPRLLRLFSLLVVATFVLAACDIGGSSNATPTASIFESKFTPPAATNTAAAVAPTNTTAAAAPTNTTAAAVPTNTTAAAAPTQPLYVSIIWHQHQPFYFKDPATGVYERPWVRMHGVKDYLDMVETAEKYNAHVTINLTPSLIRQIDDFANGAKDSYMVVTEKAVAELSDADKTFLLKHFFDANAKIINRFPRYVELKAKRGADTSDAALQARFADWQEADWRDLQVLFNLGWMDPDYLAQEPLKALVTKGKGYSDADKAAVLAQHLAIMKRIIPAHAEAIKKGIEIITTPYSHPILPLLENTNLARPGLQGSGATQPSAPFSYPDDGEMQVQLAKQLYQEKFGAEPKGMWPAEGSVAQEIVKHFANNGINWIASDEMVLARSYAITTGFERNSSGTVKLADSLYKPYKVQDGKDGKPVYILFRDHALSDEVGFNYSAMTGEKASDDMVARIKAAGAQIASNKNAASKPHLLTVLLDGENAWENYDNDGKEFLNSMYRKLTSDPAVKLVTPSEYLAQFPTADLIPKLYPGSWIDGTFSTWIGEPEENQGWDYLRRTRDFFDLYMKGTKQAADPGKLQAAKEAMLAAEGSDWFWWFGDDQDSGDDAAFDEQYRKTLAQVYINVGATPPAFLNVPIISKRAAAPTRPVSSEATVTVDGTAAAGEWDKAGQYKLGGGAMASGKGPSLYYGYDAANINLRLDQATDWSAFGNGTVNFYFGTPGQTITEPFQDSSSIPVGFLAGYAVTVNITGGQVVSATIKAPSSVAPVGSRPQPAPEGTPLPYVGYYQPLREQNAKAAAGKTLELSVPWAALGKLNTGDKLTMQGYVVKQGSAPAAVPNGSFSLNVPDRNPINFFLTVDDPKGDDHGPGSYTYPQNAVFKPGNFDIAQFQAGTDSDSNMVFRFKMNGPTENPWGSPSGLALQSFDIYVDTDHKDGSGARKLLVGRNAAVSAADSWDVAVKAEGWPDGQAVYKGSATGDPTKTDARLKVQVDAAQQVVTIRVPQSAFGAGDPATWSYLAVVMSQDGPATASGRVRDVQATAAEWKLGGAPADTNHTRIIDAALPADQKPGQEDSLKDYKPSTAAENSLTAADLGKLPMVAVRK